MNSTSFISTNDIRIQFTKAMSDMYQQEVPLYKKLLDLVKNVNQESMKDLPEFSVNQNRLLELEHHGAIRVGTATELSTIRHLFAVMGMYPVDYYDLSIAGIPVHSTAFRALDTNDLTLSPFRVFCSLLRLDLITNDLLRQQAEALLNQRQIFSEELLNQIYLSKKQGGLTAKEAILFIENAIEIFRWHDKSIVDKPTYLELKASHGLVTDVVSFKGPHINHLTPKILDIDACQNQFLQNNIKAKAVIEGPPKRNCPILLRQTSFIAIAEEITFSNNELGYHTARFGEVEQRGIALTPKGRALYDRLLLQAKNENIEIDYTLRLEEAFKEFPDDYDEIRQQGLGYFYYSLNNIDTTIDLKNNDIDVLISKGIVTTIPIIYEDFLPISAAGIFTSNLSENEEIDNETKYENRQLNGFKSFEKALGVTPKDSFELYEAMQQESLNLILETLDEHAN